MILYGNLYSVYARTMRMVLSLKKVPYSLENIDPFEEDAAESLREVHPFDRVPALRSDGFCIYETQAMLDYVEAVFPDPVLRPNGAEAMARMRQVMGIADHYFYWPLVRQAASQQVFNPIYGAPVDQAELAAGLAAAPRVLDALEAIATEALVLRPDEITLADCHLWPMMDYALMVEEIAKMVARRVHLAGWAAALAKTPVARETAPDMETLQADA
ncbi:MAG: glutathione S-transferase family protein [Pseudomonadota bacterium]